MSALGQKRTCAAHQPMSALLSVATAKADSREGHVCFTPKSGRVRRASSCLLWANTRTHVCLGPCVEGSGFGVFCYGMWDDGTGQMVPTGNGDDPAVGLTNRLYARIRNVGNAIASNVAVTFEVTDPLGMGITGPTGWVQIGRADAVMFPQLAAVPAGGTVDVYVDWKPTVNLTPAQVAAGIFYLHSCLRVRIDPVQGETILANQDGDREQENVSYFQVPPTGANTST